MTAFLRGVEWEARDLNDSSCFLEFGFHIVTHRWETLA
jgi:hypothetical protein